MTSILFILIALLVVSGLGLVVLVLLHSGKGTGVSEMIQSSMTGQMGTGLIEENLDRLTIACAAVFGIVLISLMVVYPSGTIAG